MPITNNILVLLETNPYVNITKYLLKNLIKQTNFGELYRHKISKLKFIC